MGKELIQKEKRYKKRANQCRVETFGALILSRPTLKKTFLRKLEVCTETRYITIIRNYFKFC